MPDLAEPLKTLQTTKSFFVGIDSDGCVFDTMGIKHRECFCPLLVGYFHLQPVAQAARECKDFADLFSKTRGANRHITSARILSELLPGHPLVKEREFKVPAFEHYLRWVRDPNSLLSNEGLEKAVAEAAGEEARKELAHVLTWSRRVNELIEEIVKGIPPFPYVRESLAQMQLKADMIVCSQTPTEALEREWAEHEINTYPHVIAGQEMGTKADHLKYATEGKFAAHHVLMIGDAPGDLKAARANDALFYPVNPGRETRSWQRFHEEAFDKFIGLQYAGDYQEALIAEFEAYLPENPPWQS